MSMDTFEFSQGTGEAIYGGFAGPDFEGKQARYVLLTAISNWGHESCFGLAEVKFNLTNQFSTIEPPCSEPPCNEECTAPDEVEIEMEEPTEAFLFWEGADVEFYIVRFRSIDGEWEEMETEEPELFLEALEPDTEYEFQIQAICEEESSDFSESYFFSTITEMEECFLPESTIVDLLDPNSALVSWEDMDAAEVYRFRYRRKSSFQAWVKTTNEDSFRALGNLEANTVYLYQIRVLCPNGWTAWSPKYRFKTSPAGLDVPQTGVQADGHHDDLLVFPNPAREEVNVVYRNAADSEVNLVLNNVAGQKVYQSSHVLDVGSHQFRIPLSDLEPGFYFVSLHHQNKGTTSTQRLVLIGNE
ncbi:MAG: T9SS type A sorting domain-containing protein, partial [Bacteroidota bacterium]